jgi:hypothetical protein
MRMLELQQRILALLRTSSALQDVPWNLGKAIRQSIHVAPKELSGHWKIRTMNTLKPPVSNLNLFTLSSSCLSVCLRESTKSQLLHEEKEIICQQ